jgi:hypothetical protein
LTVERGLRPPPLFFGGKKLDDVVFPNVQPPPMATQLQNLEGVASAIVVGAFCEHNDQVHSLVDASSLPSKAGPGAETETGLDNKSAVVFEKHRIRLRMAAGAWRDYHESIHARLPFVHPCTAVTDRWLMYQRSKDRCVGAQVPMCEPQAPSS